MAKENQTTSGDERLEQVEVALNRTEKYILENQKSLSIIVSAIIVVVGGFLAYNRFYVKPKSIEAQTQIYVAEQLFEKDSFRLALNGDGNSYGFLKIIDEYSATDAGNLACYYAGICNLRLGKFNEAIDYLEKFDSDDQMIAPKAVETIGDAYMELGQKDKAVKNYIKAADMAKNDFISPISLLKAGEVYEMMNDYKSALETYQRIKTEYPKTIEGRNIEKYIARVQMKM